MYMYVCKVVNLWQNVVSQHATHTYVMTITQIQRKKQPKSKKNNKSHSGKSQFARRSSVKAMGEGNKLFIANADTTQFTERKGGWQK